MNNSSIFHILKSRIQFYLSIAVCLGSFSCPWESLKPVPEIKTEKLTFNLFRYSWMQGLKFCSLKPEKFLGFVKVSNKRGCCFGKFNFNGTGIFPSLQNYLFKEGTIVLSFVSNRFESKLSHFQWFSSILIKEKKYSKNYFL